jgi:hypothetical protein
MVATISKSVRVADVFHTFAPLVGCRCAVAGGAVRDELIGRTPRDFDLFCFDQFARHAILRAPGVTFVESKRNEYAARDVLTIEWRGAVVQFVFTDDGRDDVDALLDRFDWNVCLFAYDGAIIKRMDESQIGRGHLLRLNSNDGEGRTIRTLRRGFRFADRYGMTIATNDLAALCADIVHRHVDNYAEVTSDEIVQGTGGTKRRATA